MISDVNDKGIGKLSGLPQDREKFPDLRIQTAQAVIVISSLLPQFRGIQSEIGQGFDIITGKRLFRNSPDLPDEWAVGVRIIDTEEKGPLGSIDELFRFPGIFPELVPAYTSVIASAYSNLL